jgi:DNA-binding HxlR family transcriptional regulator
MTQGSYRQFCPVAMSAEILCTRWTVVLLRELIAGSTRFNDLRRGVPRMSPALLSQRLKELEAAGVISRVALAGEAGLFEYRLTTAGRELKPLIEAFGIWGQRWVEAEPSLEHLDVGLLMWDMRRNLDPSPMPARRVVIHFRYGELASAQRHWWLLVDPDAGVDLCSVDPGFDVDLYVATDLRTMTAIWMGLDNVPRACAEERMLLTGDRDLARDMQGWLGLSPFAKERKLGLAGLVEAA